jgi:hypothetical protein
LSEPARNRMTSDEFIAWAMEQPETSHYELVAGEVVAMSPERSAHALTKARFWRRMEGAKTENRTIIHHVRKRWRHRLFAPAHMLG